MRRKWFLGCAAGTFVLAAVVWQAAFSSGDPVVPVGDAKADKNGPGNRGADNPLPIRQVVLFNTGVGYFQREGQVSGNASVDLSFPTSDMNDLLKSLILQDVDGGKVRAVSYDSHDPIEKTLRSFAIDLSTNPSFGQILNQARGENIEILRAEKLDAKVADKKEPVKPASRIAKVTGTIVGMETQMRPAESRETEIVNLTTADGLQAVPLDQVQSVRFLNATLEKEFQRALRVLARAHDTQKKTISLGFQGEGKRGVRVGYVVERPIWKATYRLRIEDGKKLFLQAWAMVENTSDDDWNDVHMVLVAGRPISFKMNLYEPLYIPRPDVEPDLFASLRPPVYSSAQPPPPGEGGPADLRPAPMGMFGNPMGMQGNPFGMQGNPFGMQGNPFMTGGQPGFAQYGQGGGFGQGGALGQGGGGGFGGNFGGGFGGNFMGNRYANPVAMQENFNAKLTYEQLQERRKLQREAREEARRVGAGLNFKEGIASVAGAEEVGDYFQYVLDQKINLPRQKSAMLPIVNQAIEGAKVSIYNYATHAKYPLLGLRLKNTSGQPLTQGPITVYDGQTYAGDTRVLDLQPGEERLLSYALDQGAEVLTTDSELPGPELYFKVGAADLATHYKVRHTRTYTIRNRSAHDRTMIVEHPITPGWKLLAPEKFTEKTRDLYRFQVVAAPGKSLVFKVTEEEERDALAKFEVAGGARSADARDDILVKLVSKTFDPRISGMRFIKGTLMLTSQVRESTGYFVQNLAVEERHANIDHIIRAGWKLLLDDDQAKTGPAVHRVRLTLPAKKTTVHEFIEERTIKEPAGPLTAFADERVKELLAHSVASADVKAGLSKAMSLLQKLRDAKAQHADLSSQLRALTDDQARMRSNLSIIPQSSEPYKRFLEKFVAQETAVENLQKQLRQAQTLERQLQQDYDTLIANLTVE